MIFVAYRKNLLFDTYIPRLLEGIPLAGSFTISSGESLVEKSSEYISALDSSSDEEISLIITDSTCSPTNFKKSTGISLNLSGTLIKNHVYFDDLFAEQIRVWTNEHTALQNVRWLALQVANGTRVNKIVVINSCICDHCVFKIQCTNDNAVCDASIWIGSKLGTLFRAEHVVVQSMAEAVQYLGDSHNLLVADYHSGTQDVMNSRRNDKRFYSFDNWPYQAMLLTLPIEVCTAQLVDRGTFPLLFDVDRMKENVIACQKAAVRTKLF